MEETKDAVAAASDDRKSSSVSLVTHIHLKLYYALAYLLIVISSLIYEVIAICAIFNHV